MKTVCPKGRVGSNPTLSVFYGEVPKLAEGAPLERVQVVNSGARVQIPPSPLAVGECQKHLKKVVDKQRLL